jgi:hypothetical protein
MCIKETTLWITCKKISLAFLLKTTLLRLFHIAQTKVKTPTQIWVFVCLSMSFSQLPKRLLTLVGGGMLYVKCTTHQKRHAKEQDINK